MKILITLVAVAFLLNGCSIVPYNYNGVSYATEAEALSAQDETQASVLNNIHPLPAPISEKSLVIGLPSLAAINEWLKNSIEGSADNDAVTKKHAYLEKYGRKAHMFAADAVEKKNIYKSTEIIETEGGHLQSKEDEGIDLLYFYIGPKAVQWYMSNKKFGRKAVTNKRAGTIETKMNEFLDSVQNFAIKE